MILKNNFSDIYFDFKDIYLNNKYILNIVVSDKYGFYSSN
jgi:hypothetical protein